MLDIAVSDPEKHGTSGVNAYVDYKISTSTDLARFSQREFFVRRRFRDFQWLREQLCAAFPAAIVPPPRSELRASSNTFASRPLGTGT